MSKEQQQFGDALQALALALVLGSIALGFLRLPWFPAGSG